MVISRPRELCIDAGPGAGPAGCHGKGPHHFWDQWARLGVTGERAEVSLLSSSLGNCKQEEMNLIYFPLSATEKGAKPRGEYTSKTKDLTLGGKMPIPRREVWYSPACPLSALWDPLPAAPHSSVSSLKSELQESVNSGYAAPAALLVLPVEAVLSHHQSDATLRGQRLPQQQQTERHGHPARLPTEVQNPGVPEHTKQNLISCKVKLCPKMDK